LDPQFDEGEIQRVAGEMEREGALEAPGMAGVSPGGVVDVGSGAGGGVFGGGVGSGAVVSALGAGGAGSPPDSSGRGGAGRFRSRGGAHGRAAEASRLVA